MSQISIKQNVEASERVPHIQRQLSALRKALRAWFCIHGLSILCAGVVGLGLVSFIIDRLFRMDRAQRAICLVLGIAFLVWLLTRFVFRPLRWSVSAEELALRVESRHRGVGGSIISALQFAAMPADEWGKSSLLIDAAIKDGEREAERLDFSDVLDGRQYRKSVGILVGALVLAVLVPLASPANASLWFRRNVMLSKDEWPKQTRLVVEELNDGVLQVPYGAALKLQVRAEGVVPAEMVVEYQGMDGSDEREEPLTLINGRFQTVFQSVTEPFQLRVAGGDDRTEWINVVVLPRPKLTDMSLTAVLPEYTGAGSRQLDVMEPVQKILKGSSLKVAVQADTELQQIRYGPEDEQLKQKKSDGGRTAEFEIPSSELLESAYVIELQDARGVDSLDSYGFRTRLVDDMPPDSRLKAIGIGSLVLATARIPLALEAEDDFGMAKTWLDLEITLPSGETIQKKVDLQMPSDSPTQWKSKHILELPQFELSPGTRITLGLNVLDRNTVTGPGIGKSAQLLFRVVTPREFQLDILGREQGLRRRFEAQLRRQRELQVRTKLLENLSKQRKWNENGSRELQRNQTGQQETLQNLNLILSGLIQIRDEIVNNRLEDGKRMEERLSDRVIVPLRGICDNLMPRCADHLQLAVNEDQRDEKLTNAIELQNSIIAVMVEIRKSMAVSKDVAEAMRLLKRVLEQQKDLNKNTKDRIEKAIESIFE